MLYSYECLSCNNEFDMIRHSSEMYKEMICPECNGEAKKVLSCIRYKENVSKAVVLNNELKTDFDGKGEKTYTRTQYKDKCKELGRQPVGLLF